MNCPSPDEQVELALQLFRSTSTRLKQVDADVCAFGLLLKQRRLTPNSALKLLEEMAGGYIDPDLLALYHGVTPEQLRGEPKNDVAA